MSWLIEKDPDAGKDGSQEEKWATEDKMGGWHHQLKARDFEHTLEDGKGWWSLEFCSLWGCT